MKSQIERAEGIERIAIEVRGVVQGVGFRPFLHRLAVQNQLNGWVCNTADGVQLEVEGTSEGLEAFTDALRNAPPPLAKISSVRVTPQQSPAGYMGFTIRASMAGHHNTYISPDIAICPDCLRELRNPADRRYRYPFINCTNCGPRFTIIKTVPYDRAGTTMAKFAMCPACAAEYGDITNRRYHAQPDCCPVCGPKLWFCTPDGKPGQGDAIEAAQQLLTAGGILAVKGLGGFHLACRADDEAAVLRLRRRKGREQNKAFALMCPDANAAARLCQVLPQEAAALQSPAHPIVLLQKRDPRALGWVSTNRALGVMLPYTPLHTLLFDPPIGADGTHFVFDALVMTSANYAGLPAILGNEEALAALAGIADGFLLHDRQIENRCDDSLVRFLPPIPAPGTKADSGLGSSPPVESRLAFIRRSRGYAPLPIPVDFDCDGILALGAEQKASFVLGKGRDAFASAHIGDLKNAEVLAHYAGQITAFQSLFGRAPALLACDAHPDYLSTREGERLAAEKGLPLLRVQHHHAHLAACMADNALQGKVLGLIWDGTGLGTDGSIWGGELLAGDATGFTRLASLEPLPLIGGEKAITQISRLGYALCKQAGCTPPAALADATQCALYDAMLQKGINCVPSSGMGRLFDAVYALLTGCDAVEEEGEAARLLEDLAADYDCANPPEASGQMQLPFRWRQEAAPPWDADLFEEPSPEFYRLELASAVPMLLAPEKTPAEKAAVFHEMLAQAALQACLRGRSQTGLERVVLSGGVFFNAILQRRIPQLLAGAGFTVYCHSRVSTGDEGLSLGQAAVAAAHRPGLCPKPAP